MSFQSVLASDLAAARVAVGTTITVAGKSVAALTRSLRPDENEYLPEGAANAAAVDGRVFAVAPADFPAGTQILTYRGQAYLVLASFPTEVAGVSVEMRVFVYRQPPQDSTTTETATEPTPGLRKPYRPPDSTV